MLELARDERDGSVSVSALREQLKLAFPRFPPPAGKAAGADEEDQTPPPTPEEPEEADIERKNRTLGLHWW